MSIWELRLPGGSFKFCNVECSTLSGKRGVICHYLLELQLRDNISIMIMSKLHSLALRWLTNLRFTQCSLWNIVPLFELLQYLHLRKLLRNKFCILFKFQISCPQTEFGI